MIRSIIAGVLCFAGVATAQPGSGYGMPPTSCWKDAWLDGVWYFGEFECPEGKTLDPSCHASNLAAYKESIWLKYQSYLHDYEECMEIADLTERLNCVIGVNAQCEQDVQWHNWSWFNSPNPIIEICCDYTPGPMGAYEWHVEHLGLPREVFIAILED